MSKAASNLLSDRDVRNLSPKAKRYKKAVGNPKELYIFVYPSGMKTFMLKQSDYKYSKINNFREGLYSVAEARKEALRLLKIIENDTVLDASKYKFKNLLKIYISQKRKRGHTEEYIKIVESMCERYLLKEFGEMDMAHIKFSALLSHLNKIFSPDSPKCSKLETIKRLIIYLNGVFNIALKDRYIEYNPTFGLSKEFPSKTRFYRNNDIDPRLPALIDKNQIYEFIQDLKANTSIELYTKNAIYLQILCVNRPINTVSAKWDYIDLDNKIWNIPPKEMKMKSPHIIALNSYAMEILKAQKSYNIKNMINSKFVFPALNPSGHIHRDTLSKALRSLNHGKWRNRVTTHGFRATFRTICSIHKAELLKLGISDEVIESALAHKTLNSVKYAYEREKANIEQLMILMQWYGDFLNRIEKLF